MKSSSKNCEQRDVATLSASPRATHFAAHAVDVVAATEKGTPGSATPKLLRVTLKRPETVGFQTTRYVPSSLSSTRARTCARGRASRAAERRA